MSGYSSRRLARFSQWIVQRYPPSTSARASRYAPVQIAPSGTRRWASLRSQAMQVLSTWLWTCSPAQTKTRSALSAEAKSPSTCTTRPLLLGTGAPPALTTRHRYNASPCIRFAIRNGSTALLNAMKE